MAKQKICAIVPAYKEEKRIGSILNELKKSIVDEIIVVDDGSNDNTEEIVKSYGIKYVRNLFNLGKGYSMDRGVSKTDADIIFFCDADLIGFDYKMMNEIIKPVLGGYEMFVGTRNLFKNKIWLWSGQRAIKRELWERLPKFFKKSFRIELGMNFYCKNFGFKRFNYDQYLKEEKYGLSWGWYRRIFMLGNLFIAIVGYYLYWRFK